MPIRERRSSILTNLASLATYSVNRRKLVRLADVYMMQSTEMKKGREGKREKDTQTDNNRVRHPKSDTLLYHISNRIVWCA